MKFKVGDVVECVDNGPFNGYPPTSSLKVGQRNKVVAVNIMARTIKLDNEYAYYQQGRFKLVEFTKASLKSGMVVQYRDGRIRIVLGQVLISDSGHVCHTLHGLTNELKSASDTKATDIMAVWAAPASCEDILDVNKKGQLLFERVEETATQKELREIEEQMKELAGRAAALREKL